MKHYWETMISTALGLAVIAIAIALVHREFFASPAGVRGVQKSEYIATWKEMLADGRTIGETGAPVTIIEFADFECPFCHRFNDALAAVKKAYPNKVAVSLVHFPLPGHQHAQAAAHAAECAAGFGRFSEAVDFLFSNQDSFGKKSWVWFALGSGVADTARFSKCMADTLTPPKVRAGVALAKAKSVHGTPTVIVNGWRYGAAPSDTELVRAVGDILAGRSPYKGFPKAAIASR